jgi:hypothetical protein
MTGSDENVPKIVERLLELASKCFFAVAGVVLLVFSMTLVGMSVVRIVRGFLEDGTLLFSTLESISLVIISIAVFDLSKFLIEEEVMRERELRSLSEARLSLNKFLTIIILAILLESIVLVFETKFENITHLIYPSGLMAVGVLALVGLGLFQRLTAEARVTDPTADDTEFDSEDHVPPRSRTVGREPVASSITRRK